MVDEDLVIVNHGATEGKIALHLDVEQDGVSEEEGEENPPTSSNPDPDLNQSGSSHKVPRAQDKQPSRAATPVPKTNEVLAWISCILFFWPIGIVAVIKSIKSQRALVRKDYKAAEFEGEAARHFGVGAIIAGVLIYVVIGVFLIYSFIITNNKVEGAHKDPKV